MFFAIAVLFLIKTVYAQNSGNEYFVITAIDEKRWAAYDDFIKNNKNKLSEKADSIYKFALIEYQNKQFLKTRELCELAIEYNPDLAKPHILIGKAYASSGNICEPTNRNIKGEILWVAFDEWEKAISKGDDEGKAAKLMGRYKTYLPDEADFKSCFGRGRLSTIDQGDAYFVKCWINRETTIRLKKE